MSETIVSNYSKMLWKLTLPIDRAPNHAESVPYGGGRTLMPLVMDGGRSPRTSFSNLPATNFKAKTIVSLKNGA